MNKFDIDERYNHITVNVSWHDPEHREINQWCRNKNNGNFNVYLTGIVYNTDQDLTAFLLRWA